MLLDMICRLLSNVCIATSFYQRPASRVYFFASFNLRNLLYLICEYFADSLYDRAKAQGYIHRTSTYGFAEHKKCMAWRIHYICELEKFLTADFDVNAYKMETEKDCEFLVNIGLKYNSTKNDRSLLKASNCAKELVRQEKEAILWLIDKIDEKYADLEKYKRIRN